MCVAQSFSLYNPLIETAATIGLLLWRRAGVRINARKSRSNQKCCISREGAARFNRDLQADSSR